MHTHRTRSVARSLMLLALMVSMTPALGAIVTPPSDPAVEAPLPFVEAARGQHPRLLFGSEDIPAMKRFIQTDRGKQFWDKLCSYTRPSRRPDEPGFLRDATDGQRQGTWRLPTIALHYVLTGEKKSFDQTVEFMKFLMDQEHWELGGETDSGMSAANIMIGAALAYDWLYNDLDPEFREAYRAKLILQARRMYYRGHLMKDGGVGYWQNDPQNNHRWHRNAGMTLCILAAAEPGRSDTDWLIARTKDDLDFVTEWLPEDGTSHESYTYMIFGGSHLMLGLTAADRCLGTDYLHTPFVRNNPQFMIQSYAPGLQRRFVFGDQGSDRIGQLAYDCYLLAAIGANGLSNELAMIDRQLDLHGASNSRAWMGIVWYPRDLKAGSVEQVPTRNFFDDLGILNVRESWDDGAAAMFKCGPFGGYELNLYRAARDMHYINVAHDDPDANSFQLFADGTMLAETDRYSKHKRSSHHNTILINDSGQTVAGHAENSVWWQPGGDMTEIAVVTALAEKGPNIAVEGEAAGSYPADPAKAPKRPALDRYRRSFFWVEGKYVLVLDDIRAPQRVKLSWLMQGPELLATDAAEGRYELKDGQARCAFQVVSTDRLMSRIVASSADHRGKPLGYQQLHLFGAISATRLASVYDLWGKGDLSVSIKADGPDAAAVTVTGNGIDDTWTWKAGDGRFAPSTITGATADGAEIITLDKPEPGTRELIEKIKRVAR